MAQSKLSQEERVRRKREAAKFRQRRCRAKKKEEAAVKKQRLQNNKAKPMKSSARIASPESVSDTTRVPIQQESKRVHTHSRTNNKKLILDHCSDPNMCMSPPPRPNSSLVPIVTPLVGDPIPQSNHCSTPQMEPLPNVTIDIQNRTLTNSTPPARIDEEELKAIGAMLSLRHSPVQDLCDKITDKSPVSFSARSIPDQSIGAFHAPLATPCNNLPFLPKIQPTNRSPNIPSTPFMGSSPYLHQSLTRRRGSTLIENGRSLRPGVYFYHN